MTGPALVLRLSSGSRVELDGPYDHGVCAACGSPDDGCLVGVTVQHSPDRPADHMLVCAPCVVGALAVRLAAGATIAEGSTDWIRQTALSPRDVRGVRHRPRTVGRPQTDEEDSP